MVSLLKKFVIIISMKRVFATILFLCISLFSLTYAETIKAGVSVQMVPKAFFGCWQVDAQLEKTNNYGTFKTQSRDLWNLSQTGDVIKLENPFTKASAQVEIKQTEGNVVVFAKTSTYDNKILRDTVTLRIDGDTFGGYNDITIETLSLYDGHVIKRDTAKYLIKGKKLGGTSILAPELKK